MREILFRGKRPCNGNWIEGYFAPFASNKGLKHSIYTGIDKGCIIPIEVIPETVGQFTGLCDKNGNKIFEGDILLEEEKEYSLEEYGEKVVGTHNIVACWNEKACGFWVRRTDKPKGKIYVPEEPLCESFAEELKVVGNIYDNPELLEEKL